IDGSVLEAGVEHFRAGRVRVTAGQRARGQSRAGTKDRPERQPMDCGSAQAWTAAEEFCTAARDSGFTRLDANAGDSDARAHFGMQPDSEGAGGCQHQIGFGGRRIAAWWPNLDSIWTNTHLPATWRVGLGCVPAITKAPASA